MIDPFVVVVGVFKIGALDLKHKRQKVGATSILRPRPRNRHRVTSHRSLLAKAVIEPTETQGVRLHFSIRRMSKTVGPNVICCREDPIKNFE